MFLSGVYLCFFRHVCLGPLFLRHCVFRRKQCVRNWFKGADTTVLSKFLEAKYDAVLVANSGHEHASYLRLIAQALKASNQFFHTVYRAGFWLSDVQRQNLIDASTDILKSFDGAAKYAWDVLWLPRFKYQPKLHMFAHVRHSLIKEAAKKARSVSPLAFSTQIDEDFVGRVCVLSRQVHGRTLHSKTLERYKIGLAGAW